MPNAVACIPEIVREHVEESGSLYERRCYLLNAPQMMLFDFQRLDERLAAHLDALAVAGDGAWPICEAELDESNTGSLFVFAAHALASGDSKRVEWVASLPEAFAKLHQEVLGAMCWNDSDRLQGIVAAMLRTHESARRLIGVAACSAHRVDPGVTTLIRDADPAVRARALRTAGELGKRELVSSCAQALGDEDPECQFWAVWSAVLLGDREAAFEKLSLFAMQEGFSHQSRALQLALLAGDVGRNHALLQPLAADPGKLRVIVKSVGLSGDPRYVPWLLGHMGDDKLARLAGESFSMITGLDISQPPFYRLRPEKVESGPSEDPGDDDVEMDEDEDLEWPDHVKVQEWWNRNGARFTTGVRHFMGTPPNRTHCIEVLKTGYQRQRIAAAYHLCLLNPGTPLFEWRAPAWRQQRELAQMT